MWYGDSHCKPKAVPKLFHFKRKLLTIENFLTGEQVKERTRKGTTKKKKKENNNKNSNEKILIFPHISKHM